MQVSGLSGSVQKASTRSRGAHHSRPGHESFVKLQRIFSHQHMSHWLHILVAVAKAESSRKIIVDDARWMTLLLGTVGVSVEYGSSQKVSSAHLRSENLETKTKGDLKSTRYYLTQSEIDQVSCAVMAVKASISVLSDNEMLVTFLEHSIAQ